MKKDPVTAEYLIAVFDLDNFKAMAREKDSSRIFSFLRDMHSLAIAALGDTPLVIYRNTADSALMVFEPEGIDGILGALRDLKEGIERFRGEQGFPGRVSFACHLGEITLGGIGSGPFESLDAYGDPVNETYLMVGKPFKNRFVISPSLFRRLERESRRDYHKYTPPIVYLAD